MVRIKHRYLLVNILYPDSDKSKASSDADPPLPAVVDLRRPSPAYLNAATLIRHIREHVEETFGDYGMGMTGSGLTVKYFSQATSTFILRCPRAHYRMVWAALTFMTALPKADQRSKGRPGQQSQEKEQVCIMHVVRVSGTIRKSEEEAVRRARADILRAERQQKGEGAADASRTLDAIFGSTDAGMAEGIEDDDSEEEGSDDEDDRGI